MEAYRNSTQEWDNILGVVSKVRVICDGFLWTCKFRNMVHYRAIVDCPGTDPLDAIAGRSLLTGPLHNATKSPA